MPLPFLPLPLLIHCYQTDSSVVCNGQAGLSFPPPSLFLAPTYPNLLCPLPPLPAPHFLPSTHAWAAPTPRLLLPWDGRGITPILSLGGPSPSLYEWSQAQGSCPPHTRTHTDSHTFCPSPAHITCLYFLPLYTHTTPAPLPINSVRPVLTRSFISVLSSSSYCLPRPLTVSFLDSMIS